MKEQWIYEQFSTIDVGDARLQKRAVDVAIGCAERPEGSLAGRFDEWKDLQGAYRFFNNPKITHQALQQPHYDQVLEKARFSEKLVLIYSRWLRAFVQFPSMDTWTWTNRGQ